MHIYNFHEHVYKYMHKHHLEKETYLLYKDFTKNGYNKNVLG